MSDVAYVAYWAFTRILLPYILAIIAESFCHSYEHGWQQTKNWLNAEINIVRFLALGLLFFTIINSII